VTRLLVAPPTVVLAKRAAMDAMDVDAWAAASRGDPTAPLPAPAGSDGFAEGLLTMISAQDFFDLVVDDDAAPHPMISPGSSMPVRQVNADAVVAVPEPLPRLERRGSSVAGRSLSDPPGTGPTKAAARRLSATSQTTSPTVKVRGRAAVVPTPADGATGSNRACPRRGVRGTSAPPPLPPAAPLLPPPLQAAVGPTPSDFGPAATTVHATSTPPTPIKLAAMPAAAPPVPHPPRSATHTLIETHLAHVNNIRRLNALANLMRDPQHFIEACQEIALWCSDPRAYAGESMISLLNCLRVRAMAQRRYSWRAR